MASQLSSHRTCVALGTLALVALTVQTAITQQAPARFGGAYAELDSRRQQLVDNWVSRFNKVAGQKVEAGPFYDEVISLSTKTTFEAVTHALMTTPLTDSSGGRLDDALALVEQVDGVRGEVPGASGDRQFRMYVRLRPDARDTLERSKEFSRGVDNTVYHKGYPLNYREQGGTPSIQISTAPDGQRADIDVDYRSSSFPVSLFNGHLTASNSDVRAGNNFDRHSGRWTGLQSWWRGFFGVRLERGGEQARAETLSKTPRAGKKNIDVMVNDFLQAWLVEGDIVAAMSYVSDRSYACLAQDADDPSSFDRGVAPYQLMGNLKAAHDALGKRESLDGLIVGVRLGNPALKVIQQPHHAQFVISSVPDDVAAAFDCESRLTLGDGGKKVGRAYGKYFGATFYVNGQKNHRVALLWAKEDGYWKIVSWHAGAEDREIPVPDEPAPIKVARIEADPTLVQTAHGFLETWLIRKDYDAAFRYLSPKIYACYDLVRNPDAPASTSPADAGQKIRANLEGAGTRVHEKTLETLITSAEPFHPSIRVMDHLYERTFSLASIPNALADAAECDARARNVRPPLPLPLDYGNAAEMTLRFQTKGGDAPVLRTMWRKEDADWRITSYAVEVP